jgi:hypothetical protein
MERPDRKTAEKALHRQLVKLAMICIATLLAQTPALAIDVCPDLWLSRNAIFNDAGYCFKSPLGKAVFDNNDCSTQSPKLSARLQAKVAQIKSYEKNFGCRINTKRRDLAVYLINLRVQLLDHPVADGFESTCLGVITDRPITLHVGKSAASEVIGLIADGDTIDFAHEPEGDWDFASAVSRNGNAFPVLGWYRSKITPDTCREYAG